jgi:glycosyltransferase involved in cell wall biosynthesis
MKIGFDAKRLFFNGSGLGVYSRSTLDVLLKYAPMNEYTLFSPREGNRYGFEVPGNVNVVLPGGMASRFGSLWRSYAMGGAIRRSGVDIYHGLSAELPADIRRAKVRSVVTIHDLIFVHHPQLYKPIDRYLYTKKYGRSCREADRIIAISKLTADELVRFWKIPASRIDVVYQGCNPVFEHRATEQCKMEVRERYRLPAEYILSVGSIEPRKNLLLTVKAMAERRLGGDFVACGRHTPYADEIMDYARQHGIADRVHLRHDVTFDDLPAIYQMAEVFVYPSFYEGFGIPILEAFNSRVPVITTRGGVFPETGGDACIYIDPHSPKEMTEAIRNVRLNGPLREEMITRGLGHAALFSESAIAGNLMAVYDSVL